MKNSVSCCSMMVSNLAWTPCGYHESPMACPDAVVVATPDGGVGLPVRDGERGDASSWISIWHCPWCGKELPGHERHEDAAPLGR